MLTEEGSMGAADGARVSAGWRAGGVMQFCP